MNNLQADGTPYPDGTAEATCIYDNEYHLSCLPREEADRGHMTRITGLNWLAAIKEGKRLGLPPGAVFAIVSAFRRETETGGGGGG